MSRSVQSYLVSAIRRVWGYSLARRECLKNAKVCYLCEEPFLKPPKGLYKDRATRKEWRKAFAPKPDHVTPVGPAPRDWKGWDAYLKRMFEGKLRPACKSCHDKKSAGERKKFTAERKKREGKK